MSNQKALSHYGVEGMKWGVHKKYYKDHMDSDRTLKKGFTIQNISRNEKRNLSRNTPVYGAHTDHDKNAYAGNYAKSMTTWNEKAIVNSLVLTRDVKIPSQKKTIELFMTMYKNDPIGVSESIGKGYAELDYFNGIAKMRDYNAKRISKKFTKKGEDWVRNKGYLMFNQSMMAPNESKAQSKYYDILLKQKYSAISDINDVQTGYGADDPIIFINPKKTLKNVQSRQLTPNEIELASARYDYDEVLKLKGLDRTILNSNYRDAKNQLKKVEKKQGLPSSIIK